MANKAVLIILLLLVVAGMAGGAYYFYVTEKQSEVPQTESGQIKLPADTISTSGAESAAGAADLTVQLKDCSQKHTEWNDVGGWRTNYLDRQAVKCEGENEVLSGFKLEASGDKARYAYTCCNVVDSKNTKLTSSDAKTGDDDAGDWNTIYLDRHNVDCSGSVLGGFRAVASYKPNKIRYDYSCKAAPSAVSWTCTDKSTNADQESKNFNYLDRHDVKCADDEVMSQFRLQRVGDGKFKYAYKCCKPKAI